MTTPEQPTTPSAPTSTTTTTTEPEPPKKMEFWRAVFESMTAPPAIDFEKFAKLAGYKNVQTARVVYYTKKRSLGVGEDKDKSEESVDGAKKTKVPKTSKASGNGVAKTRNKKPKVQGKKDGCERKRRKLR